MSDTSGRLGLPYIRAGQLQKHVTLNEALWRLDGLVQTVVQSRSLNLPPQVVEEGQLYIIGSAPTGAWSSYSTGALVSAELSGWRELPVTDGMQASLIDEGLALIRLNGAWSPLSQAMGQVLSVEKLGVDATPDASNPFSARVNKALWAARATGDGGDGSIRFTFNKQTAAHTASVLFQSAWSGRAEFGLAGDDDLRLKVSANGNDWHEALRVDRATGRIWFPEGATRREVTVMTTSGNFSVPSWARWIEAVCVGGGGGGGAGQFGSSGVRRGGGGGGAGGYTQSIWMRDNLDATLNIAIGAAGTAGNAGNGGAGGNTTISTFGNAILKAAGGNGGRLGGAAGLGGVGDHLANSGATNIASNGLPDAALISHGLSAGGGGAGGGLSTSNEAFAGSAASSGGNSTAIANGGNGGTAANGSAGAVSSLNNINRCGGGGGGGGARAAGAGFNGGTAGGRGAGGGGGGAGSTSGGLGGAGTAGVVILTAVG